MHQFDAAQMKAVSTCKRFFLRLILFTIAIPTNTAAFILRFLRSRSLFHNWRAQIQGLNSQSRMRSRQEIRARENFCSFSKNRIDVHTTKSGIRIRLVSEECAVCLCVCVCGVVVSVKSNCVCVCVVCCVCVV